MYSRLTFTVKRNASFPEAALLLLIVSPAQGHGLRGRVDVIEANRYSAILEGPTAEVSAFHTYLVEYLEFAVGEFTEEDQTDDVAELLSNAGVKITMPE